jgi:hypothetical protein
MDDNEVPQTPDLETVRAAARAADATRLFSAATIAQARLSGATLRQVSEAAGISHEQVRRIQGQFKTPVADLQKQLAPLRKISQDPGFQKMVADIRDQAATLSRAIEGSGITSAVKDMQSLPAASKIIDPATRRVLKNIADAAPSIRKLMR